MWRRPRAGFRAPPSFPLVAGSRLRLPPPPAGGALLQPAAVQEVLAFLFLTVTVAAVIVALLFRVSLVPCERASSSLAEPHLDLDL